MQRMMAPDPRITPRKASDRARARLDRQLDAMAKAIPSARRPLNTVRARGWWVVRLPIALLFLAGGLLAILPVFGLWMIPVGLMLLAIDLPLLRGPVSSWMVRMRRRVAVWRHKGRPKGR